MSDESELPSLTASSASSDALKSALRSNYFAYIKTANEVFQGGGDDVELLRPYVTSTQLTRERESVARFRKVGSRVTGGAVVRNFVVQYVDMARHTARAYACLDVSNSKVIDSAGKNVTPADRPDEANVEVSFLGQRISMSEPWTGSSVC